MTREEAIKALRVNTNIGYGVVIEIQEWDFIGTREIKEALNMAIEALSAEPCEDCISRAEAIKALEYNLSVEADGGLDKYRTVIKDLLNAIYNTQKAQIEALPSVQPIRPKGKWTETTVRGSMSLVCSECGADLGSICETNFCPTCGADMRGEE